MSIIHCCIVVVYMCKAPSIHCILVMSLSTVETESLSFYSVYSDIAHVSKCFVIHVATNLEKVE